MPPGFDSLPVHDEVTALDMVDGERELLEEVIGLFRDNTADRIADLVSAVAAADARAIANAAHSIKGAAANICAERIRALADELEKVALQGGADPMADLCDHLRAEFERFNREVAFCA